METLSPEAVRHLAHLARLVITDEASTRYAEQLTAVVQYIEQLKQVPVDGVQPPANAAHTVLAADLPRAATSLAAVPSERLIAGAPRSGGRFIEVQAVMQDDGGSS